jgi:hypothetical protein
MVILFFPYYRRLFITRHKKMGPISTDSPEFEAAEKELEQIENS